MSAKARKHLRHRRTRVFARGDRYELDARVLREQAHQLHTRISGPADDACPDHSPPCTRTNLKRKSRPWAAFPWLRDRRPLRSAFRELLAPPRLMQADLLSLHFA